MKHVCGASDVMQDDDCHVVVNRMSGQNHALRAAEFKEELAIGNQQIVRVQSIERVRDGRAVNGFACPPGIIP